MEKQKQSAVAVVMVPLPAQGHLNQLLHLSHHIVSYGLPVHFAGSAMHNRQAQLRIQGWNSAISAQIHFHDFQLPTNPNHHLRDPVFELSKQLATNFRRIIVVHDHGMSSVVQDVRFIPNAELFHFVPTSAFTEFLSVWESLGEKPFELDPTILPRGGLPSTEGATPPEIAAFMSYQDKFLKFDSGKLYNTSMVIEGEYVHLLEKLSVHSSATHEMKHFALGPFNPVEPKTDSGNGERHRCLEWLDEQEKCSVVYISFGSTVSLPEEQIRELAAGLERSGQKFIWVLRNADKSDIFATGEIRGTELPEGYEERVEERGMVVRDWAPQLDILAHPSTGGFMSHCGWNSCLESISMGVPIAAWPMHCDQPRNAVLITQMLRVGVTVRDWEHRGEVIKSGVIESALNTLMISEEGEEVRRRAAELGATVRQSVSPIDAFIAHITR